MADAPMIAPDGTPGFIPQEQVDKATQAGFSRGVSLWTKDGKNGIVPLSRAKDALASGLSASKPTPKTDAPGPTYTGEAWSATKSVVGGLASGMKQMLTPHATAGGMSKQEEVGLGPTGRLAYNTPADLVQGGKESIQAGLASRKSGENLAGQVLSGSEHLPIVGGLVRKAEEAGPTEKGQYSRFTPQTFGSLVGGVETAAMFSKGKEGVEGIKNVDVTGLGKTARRYSEEAETKYVRPDEDVQKLRGATNNVIAKHNISGNAKTVREAVDNKINELMPRYDSMLQQLDNTGATKSIGSRVNAIIDDAIAKESNPVNKNKLETFKDVLTHEVTKDQKTGKWIVNPQKAIGLDNIKPSDIKKLVVEKADDYGFNTPADKDVIAPVARRLRYAANETMWGDVNSGKQLGRDISHLIDNKEQLHEHYLKETRGLGSYLHASVYGSYAGLGTAVVLRELMHATLPQAGGGFIAAYALASGIVDAMRSTTVQSTKALLWNKLADIVDPQHTTDIWPSSLGQLPPNFGPVGPPNIHSPGPARPPISPTATSGPVQPKPQPMGGPSTGSAAPGSLSANMPVWPPTGKTPEAAVTTAPVPGMKSAAERASLDKINGVKATPAQSAADVAAQQAQAQILQQHLAGMPKEQVPVKQQTVGSAAGSKADTDFYRQAAEQLGKTASMRDIIKKAQELKSGKAAPSAEKPASAGPKSATKAPESESAKPEPLTVGGKRTDAGRAADAKAKAEKKAAINDSESKRQTAVSDTNRPDVLTADDERIDAKWGELRTINKEFANHLRRALSNEKLTQWSKDYHEADTEGKIEMVDKLVKKMKKD